MGDEKKEKTEPTNQGPFPPPVSTTGPVPRPETPSPVPWMAHGWLPTGGNPEAAAALWAQYAAEVKNEQTNRTDNSTRDIANQPRELRRDAPPGAEAGHADVSAELTAKVEQVRKARATEGDPQNVSKTTRSPMLAGVMDTASGSVFTAGNTDQIPENLHPIMKERLMAQRMVLDAYRGLALDERQAVAGMKAEEMEEFMKSHHLPSTAGGMDTNEMLRLIDSRTKLNEQRLQSDPKYQAMTDKAKQDALFNPMRAEIGTHGEFHALNAALLARDTDPNKPITPADLGGFLLHNTYADPQRGKTDAGPMARCHHCEALTGGVGTTSALAHADAHRDRHLPGRA